jgi:hypothetical protein
MNKYIIILALETLLEQVNDAKDFEKIKEIEEQIKIMKEYDYNE